MVMNGVPVARPGLILGEDEATTSRKVFKHLPGHPGPVFGPKTYPKIQNLKNHNVFVKKWGSAAWAEPLLSAAPCNGCWAC